MIQNIDFKTILKDELELFHQFLHKAINTDSPLLRPALTKLFETSGKQLRPLLLLLTAKSCGGVTEASYHAAVTVELLHTATLVHDDVIDDSSLRRGQPSLNALYDNTRAVLIGDYLLSTSLVESTKTNNIRIVRAIAELGQNLSEGELLQLQLAADSVISEEQYFKVIDKKTASLIKASTLIGAITAGASEECTQTFAQFGEYVGIAFQMRDDIFDYFKQDVGKPTGNDIREGKITLPLLYALRSAPQDVSDAMLSIIKSKVYDEANIESLLTFAKTQGGIEYTTALIDDYLTKAEALLTKLPHLSDEYRGYLHGLLLYLRTRGY